MANDIELKMEVVNSTIAEAKSTIAGNQSGIDSEYSALISQFAESSGETADALRSLQKAEQELADDMWAVLTELGDAINFAAEEFSKLDTDMKNIMN